MSKYRAVRTNGCASKREAARKADLELMERAGMIKNLRHQVSFDLLPANKDSGYPRPLRYIADSVYDLEVGDGWESRTQRVIEDVKGFKTPAYLIKKRLMAQLLGIVITEV